MNAPAVIQELQRRFPGKKIVRLPEKDPTEIIVEVRRTSEPSLSVAMAVIEKSQPHFHKSTHELYNVVRGSLHLHIDDSVQLLKPGQAQLILPDQVHWAEGNPAWVWVICIPAWTPDDHILVEESQ